MKKNSLFNIVKSDIKMSKNWSVVNKAMQTQSFSMYTPYKLTIRVLTRESMLLMSDSNKNENI